MFHSLVVCPRFDVPDFWYVQKNLGDRPHLSCASLFGNIMEYFELMGEGLRLKHSTLVQVPFL